MNINNCQFCKKKLTHACEEYFFYCDEKCMDQHKEQRREKAEEGNLLHNPPARRGEVDHTNAIVKTMLLQKMEDFNEVGKPKSGRKCGKCGESGHNARTCKQ
jgi:hypothetical protein